jgi:hypothetical protein
MNMQTLKEFVIFPLHVMVRPFSSFSDIKWGLRGSAKMIPVMLFLMWAAISFNNQYAGIVVNQRVPMMMNSIRDMYGVVAVFLLACIGNWSITCLTDGEGKFIQIMKGISYALTPYYLALFIAALISRFFTEQEAAFYYMIISGGLVWASFLVFAAVATIHNFTVFRTILTLFLTALSMSIIIFFILMIGALLQQVTFFGHSIYLEISNRI